MSAAATIINADATPDAHTVTVTIRCVRSFEHRNVRNIVLRDVDLRQSVQELQTQARRSLQTNASLPPPFKTHAFDSFKIESHAFGAKTNDVVMTRADDATLILPAAATLLECGVRHETEITFFKMEDYLKFKES